MLCCRQERGSDVEAMKRDHVTISGRSIELEQPVAESICLHIIILYTVHDIA